MNLMRWVQGETGKHPAAQLDTGAPEADTLQGATVTWTVESLDGDTQLLNDAAVSVEDEPGMKVSYDRQAADVDAHGRFRFRYRVAYSDGSVQYFPTQGFGLLIIEPSGGAA